MAPRERLPIVPGLSLPLEEIEIRATTSGGPGGQHANRALTRIEARFDVAGSSSLSDQQRERIIERLGTVVSAASSDERSQARNRETAVTRLAEKLAAALHVERPRRPTRPTRGSVTRRLDAKRRTAVRKAERRSRPEDG